MNVDFLLDEGVPILVTTFLKKREHRAYTLQELNKRQYKNGDVARLAIEKDAILITVDADFLNIKKNLLVNARIIYIHVHPTLPNEIVKVLEDHLDSCLADLKNPGTITLTQDTYLIQRPN